ncbi:hypothetical protein D3C86_1450860 [compost metagenome]
MPGDQIGRFDAGGRHSGRLEHQLIEKAVEGFPPGRSRRMRQKLETEIIIAEVFARRFQGAGLVLGQVVQNRLHRRRVINAETRQHGLRQVRQTRGVVQQVPHGDAGPARRRIGEIATDRSVEIHLAVFAQAQDGDGRQILAGRKDLEPRFGRVGDAIDGVGLTTDMLEQHLAAPRHREHPGKFASFARRDELRLKRRKIRSLGCRGRHGRQQEQ